MKIVVSSALKQMVARSLVYTAVMLVLMGLVLLDVFGFSQRGFSEISWVEFSQLFFLLVSACLCWRIFKTGRLANAVFLLMAFFAASFIRECDGFLDAWLFHGSWKFFVTPLVVFALWRTWRRRAEFVEELSVMAPTTAFGFLCSGFFTTYVGSRFFGMSFLWKNIMGEGYMRIVKDAAEECMELLGYAFLFFGIIELFFLAKRLVRKKSDEDPV